MPPDTADKPTPDHRRDVLGEFRQTGSKYLPELADELQPAGHVIISFATGRRH